MPGAYRKSIERFRRNSVFFSTFLILAGLTFIVVAAFYIFASNLYSSNLRESHLRSNRETLSHTSSSADFIIGQMLATVSGFMRNATVVEALVAPNERNYTRNRSVVEQMTTILRSGDDSIAGFFLYVPSNDTIYASDNDVINYTSFFEFDRKAVVEAYVFGSDALNLVFGRDIQAQLHQVDGRLYLYYAFPAPSLLGLAVLEIDEAAFLDGMNIDAAAEMPVYVYNTDMEPLFASVMTYPEFAGRLEPPLSAWEQDDMLWYGYTAPTTRWSFVCGLSQSSLTLSGNIDFLSVLPFIVFFITVSLAFALLITYRIYRPISRLMATVSALKAAGGNTLPAKNEFDYFQLAFTDIAQEVKRFKGLTEELAPAILERLFGDILAGSCPEDSEIELILNSLGNPHRLFEPCLVIIGDMAADANKSQTERKMYHMRIEALLREYQPEGSVLFCMAGDEEGYFVAVLSYPPATSAAIVNRGVSKLLGEVNLKTKQFPSVVLLAAGRICESLRELNLSYEEARQSLALMRRMEEKAENSQGLQALSGQEEGGQLTKLVPYYIQLAMEGSREKAEALIARHIAELAQRSADSRELHNELRRFAELLLSHMEFLKLGGEALFSAGNRLLEKPEDKYESPQQMQRQMISFCSQLLDAVDDAGHKNSLRYIQAVRDYILEHYQDSNLSLNAISAHVGLSSSYLSRLFHEHMKQGFSEYVNIIRVENAKRQLAKKKMTSAEVALICGFNSIQSFNRVFKKYVGTTPGQYKAEQKGGVGSAASPKA